MGRIDPLSLAMEELKRLESWDRKQLQVLAQERRTNELTPQSPPPSAEGSLAPSPKDTALRYDQGKTRFDLLPADAIDELAQVYTMGAQKYAERNWEKGMPYSKCFASMMRHAWAFWKGETLDKESGLHHMAHVAWNALALVSYTKRNVGEDNRP